MSYKRKEYNKKYREEHKEYFKLYAIEWRKKNKEHSRKVWNEWYYKNKEHRRSYRKKYEKDYSKKHRLEVRQYRNNFHKRHPEVSRLDAIKRRIRIRNVSGKFLFQEWENLKKKNNYTCLICGKKEPEIQLVVDHIIPICRWNEWIKEHSEIKYQCNDIDNIQPLCRSCNAKKHDTIFK